MGASGKSGYLQQRAEKQNHLPILVKSIHAEVCGSASSLLLFQTASGVSTLCRQTPYTTDTIVMSFGEIKRKLTNISSLSSWDFLAVHMSQAVSQDGCSLSVTNTAFIFKSSGLAIS